MNRRFEWTAMLVIAVGVAGGIYWWRYGRVDALPAYLAKANGRLEMTRIDVAVKYPGRIVDLPIHEGDSVQAGMILARQDTAEVQTQILGAEAQRQRALSAIARAEAELDVHRNNQRLAHLEWSQTATMRGKALVSQVELERRKIGVDAGTAGIAAATGGVNEARNALAEADAQIARLKVILGEATIRAPASGRIEYRIVEKDAVLPAGGRIASLLEYQRRLYDGFPPLRGGGKAEDRRRGPHRAGRFRRTGVAREDFIRCIRSAIHAKICRDGQRTRKARLSGQTANSGGSRPTLRWRPQGGNDRQWLCADGSSRRLARTSRLFA